MPLLSTDQLAVERGGVTYRTPAGDLADLVPPPSVTPPTRVGYISANGPSGTIPNAALVGDLLVVVAAADGATPPTAPAGWTTAFQSSDAGGGLIIGWQLRPSLTSGTGSWAGANGLSTIAFRNFDPAKPLGAIDVNFDNVAGTVGTAPLLTLQGPSATSLWIAGINLVVTNSFSGSPDGWESFANGSRFSLGQKLDVTEKTLAYIKSFSGTRTWRGYGFEVLGKPAA
jgi:hypothetical protein